jgi:hypothetical protein
MYGEVQKTYPPFFSTIVTDTMYLNSCEISYELTIKTIIPPEFTYPELIDDILSNSVNPALYQLRLIWFTTDDPLNRLSRHCMRLVLELIERLTLVHHDGLLASEKFFPASRQKKSSCSVATTQT